MSNAILATLLTVNLAAGAAILLVLIARKPVRQMLGARAAYGLWIAPLLAGLAGIVPARTITLTIPAAPPPAAVQLDAPFDFSAPLPALPAVAASHALAPPIDIAQLLVIAWAVVAVAMLAVILLRQQRIVRRLGRDSAVGPAVVGVFRPRLIMPVDFETRFSPRERDLVLAHERAHIAAGDTRINAGLALLTCLNWFNPLVHLAARLARVDQELACDAAVVERFPGERRIYAEALLKTQLSSASLPLGCTWPARSSNLLKERVMMLALKSPGRKRRMIGAAAIATLGLSAGLAAWAARPAVTVYVEEPAPPVAATVDQQKLEKLSRDVANAGASEQQALEQLEQDTAKHKAQIEANKSKAKPQPIKQVTPPVEANELRIVAVKRGHLTIRSPKGETFVDRVLEPGESYAPKLGAGWRVEVDDGAAFEWRMGSTLLKLPYIASGPTQQNVDAVAQQARLQLKLDSNKTDIERQVQIEKLIAGKQAQLGGGAKVDDTYEKAIASQKDKTAKLNPDADQQLYYRLREQLNQQAPTNAGSRLPDGQMIEATGSVTVGDKETISLGTYVVLPGDVSVKSVKLQSGKWFAVASRYDAAKDGVIVVRSAALIDGEVVANPTLTVKSGQEARLTIGGVIDLRIKPTLQEMTAEDRNAAKAIQTVKPAPPRLDPAKLQAPTFQVIPDAPKFLPGAPTFSVAPDPNAPWPLTDSKLTCDDWPSISNNDPLVPHGSLKQQMPITFTFVGSLVKAVDISSAAPAFQAREFPKALADGHPDSFRMARDTASYRVASRTLVDSFSFGSLDRDKPSVTWSRIRIDGAGPHEVFLEGRCHR